MAAGTESALQWIPTHAAYSSLEGLLAVLYLVNCLNNKLPGSWRNVRQACQSYTITNPKTVTEIASFFDWTEILQFIVCAISLTDLHSRLRWETACGEGLCMVMCKAHPYGHDSSILRSRLGRRKFWRPKPPMWTCPTPFSQVFRFHQVCLMNELMASVRQCSRLEGWSHWKKVAKKETAAGRASTTGFSSIHFDVCFDLMFNASMIIHGIARDPSAKRRPPNTMKFTYL